MRGERRGGLTGGGGEGTGRGEEHGEYDGLEHGFTVVGGAVVSRGNGQGSFLPRMRLSTCTICQLCNNKQQQQTSTTSTQSKLLLRVS